MQAKRPEKPGIETEQITPSQRLRDIFRLPRRGQVRNANDNPAPLRWLLKRGVGVAVPLMAFALLAGAVILGMK